LLEALGQISADAQGLLTSDAVPSLKRIVMMGDSKIPGAIVWDSFRNLGKQSQPSALIACGRNESNDQSEQIGSIDSKDLTDQRHSNDADQHLRSAVTPQPIDTALIV
jgi:hypothetical protein